ncbi:glycosyl transferase family 1 [Alsobacter soli]|uniref:Glycosyl transferase family 1 n=1 Tax=Alsobacter soli TaxID=2109933 RepID=A0A2T1HTQ5_9HYPH|nr:GNAT family N-acetyltransferase [Alsobacter soli]PSC05043.1 glycosyl transferase family 1 [Alsobacter soli]
MSELQVETIRDKAALAGLAPAWRDLWARAGATPFQAPEWLLPWWDVFHPGALAAFAVWNGPALVGLGPLYVEDGPHGRRLLPVGISLSDHVDVLLDPSCAQAAAGAMAEAVARLGLPLQFVDLAPGTSGWRLPLPAGWFEQRGEGEPCPVLALSPGPEDGGGLPVCIPAARRRKVRMARHRAERRGEVHVERCGPEQSHTFLCLLSRLHGARWRDRGEAGVLDDDRVQQFHRAAASGLLGAGLAEALVLRIGGVVAGCYYGLKDASRSYAYIGGFDPEFARESPGAILLGQAIGDAARRGSVEFSFLRGAEAYKYEWGAQDRHNGWRLLAPSGHG